MKRKAAPIRTVSLVRVGDRELNTAELPPERRQELADRLNVTALNAFYAGKYTAHVKKSGA